MKTTPVWGDDARATIFKRCMELARLRCMEQQAEEGRKGLLSEKINQQELLITLLVRHANRESGKDAGAPVVCPCCNCSWEPATGV